MPPSFKLPSSSWSCARSVCSRQRLGWSRQDTCPTYSFSSLDVLLLRVSVGVDGIMSPSFSHNSAPLRPLDLLLILEPGRESASVVFDDFDSVSTFTWSSSASWLFINL